MGKWICFILQVLTYHNHDFVGSCIFLDYTYLSLSFFQALWFCLAPQDILGSSCTFPVPVLQLAKWLKGLIVLFHWSMVFRNQDLSSRWAHWILRYRSTWTTLLKIVKAVKNKGRLRTYFKFKETQRTWQLNTRCDFWVGSWTKKNISGASGEM